MATAERERWTSYRCPKCGAYLRLFGDIRYEMMMCMDRCHDLCYWPDDYKDGVYIGGLDCAE